MKSYKRTFLTNKSADSYVRWDIKNYKSQEKYHTRPTMDGQLKIADCTRTVHLEFGSGYGDEKQQLKKVHRFRQLMNEFCDEMEKAYKEYEKDYTEYKRDKAKRRDTSSLIDGGGDF